MRQQVLNGDLAIGRNEVVVREARASLGVPLQDGDLGTLELRQETRYRIVQADLPLFHQHEHGHAGDGLGHGGQAEDGVLGEGQLGLEVHQAMRLEVHDAATASHQRHRTRDLSRVNVALHGFVDPEEALGGEANLLGLADRQAGGDQRGGQSRQE